jgi:site-specific DNA-methyltransferase (adenine-specific)
MSRSLDKYAAMERVEDRSSVGEVTTPIALAGEMIAKIPEAYFISDSTTFLDPCFGNGTFIIELIKKLKSYGHSIENIETRVFGCEISKRLVNKVKKRLAKYNFDGIIQGDSLEREWNMKFDVVVGNPPYNGTGQGKQKIFHEFIDKGCTRLEEDGVLLFVIPRAWFLSDESANKAVRKTILSKGTLIEQLPNDAFNADVRTCYFTAKNKVREEDITLIEGDKINTWKPSKDDDYVIVDKVFKSILEKVRKHCTEPIKTTNLQAKHEVKVDKLSKAIDKLGKEGITYLDKDICTPNSDKYRLVHSYPGGKNRFAISQMGMLEPGVQNRKGYIQIVCKSKEHAFNLDSLFKTNLIKYVFDSTRTSMTLDGSQFKFIPLLDDREWRDESAYKFFGISKAEQKIIENYQPIGY